MYVKKYREKSSAFVLTAFQKSENLNFVAYHKADFVRIDLNSYFITNKTQNCIAAP